MKKILVLLVVLLAVGATGGWWWFGRGDVGKVEPRKAPAEQDQRGKQVEQVDRVELTVDFGDGKISTKSAEFGEELSVYTLLTKQDEFQLETKQYDFGVFVKSIDGYESTAFKAWVYFVNGKSGDIAADKYALKVGDKVEWKYLKAN